MSETSRSGKVLILARETVAAALLGLLVELEAFEPVFAEPNESPEEAVRRVRPLLVVLLDVDLDAARSDLFFARAGKRRAPVILFGNQRAAARITKLARERGVRSFTLPAEAATIAGLIAPAVARDTSRPLTRLDRRRSGGERRRPTSRRDADGALVFRDRTGRSWHVYDRRGRDRRGGVAGGSAPSYRAFVADDGEEWRYDLTPNDRAATTPTALERQLAAAVRYAPGSD